MASKHKFPKGYRSPFRHFLMPLRNVHRLSDVHQCFAICRVKIFKKDHYKSTPGDTVIVPVALEQGTAKHIRSVFYLANGKIDEDEVRVYFNGSTTAQYAEPDDKTEDGAPKRWVLGIYFLKSKRARRITARKHLKKSGGFKKERHASKSRKPDRSKDVRRGAKAPKGKRRK